MENAHRLALDTKASECETILRGLEDEIRGNRDEQGGIREKLSRMQRATLESAQLELQQDSEVWDIERDYLMDDMVLKKMELEKVQERRRLLEDLQMERLAAVESIEEERNRRRDEQDNKLERLLGRIPHMQGVLTVDHDLTTKVMGDYGEEDDGKVVFKLGEEVNTIRKEEFDRKIEEGRKAREELEKARVEKEDRFKALETERVKLDRIVGRGSKYLVDMELARVRDEADEGDFDVAGVVEMEREVKVDLIFRGLGEDVTSKADKDKAVEDTVVLFEDLPEEEVAAVEKKPEEGGKEGKVGEEEGDKTPDPPSPPQEPVAETPDYKKLIEAFYEKHNKEKMGDAEKALKDHEGKEKKLFAKLAKKYNAADPLVEELKRLDVHNKEKLDAYKAAKAEHDKKVAAAGKAAPADKSPPPPEYKLPAHLAKLTRQVSRLMPQSEQNLSELESQIESLESEVNWVTSTKPDSWENASARLEMGDEDAAKAKRLAYVPPLPDRASEASANMS